MPPEQPPQQKTSDELKRIRTYQSDVEELMRRQPVSKAEIAIAENERRVKREVAAPQEVPSPPAPESKVLRISSDIPLVQRSNIGLIALVCIGIAVFGGIGVGAFFFFKDTARPAVLPPKIEVPRSAAITLERGESRTEVIKAIQSAVEALSVPQNEVRTIAVTLEGADITTPELFLKLQTSAPASLVRALRTAPILGVHGFKGGQPFLLFGVSSYDYAFAGMLQWERDLLEDIGPVFGIVPRKITGKASSTTTEALENIIVIKDVILRNKDARAAFDPKGRIVFLYAFIDKQTLVLTTNEDTLRTLVGKAGGGRLR